MEYTKGKWQRHSAPNGYHIWAGDVHIADVGDKEDSEQSTNAYLITAAPDMYEALREIKHLLETHDLPDVVLQQVLEGKCFIALAKAECK